MYVDPAVRGQGDSVDDDAEFDTDEDITYCWDLDGIDNQVDLESVTLVMHF